MTKIFLDLAFDEMGNLFVKGVDEKCFELLQNVLYLVTDDDVLATSSITFDFKSAKFVLVDIDNFPIKQIDLPINLPRCVQNLKDHVETFGYSSLISISINNIEVE